MEVILREIERALDAGLYYLAVASALTLPDICSALESPDGETSKAKYRAWFDTWLQATYPQISSLDIYSLRCGVVHQGTSEHARMQYSRIVFTLPNPQGIVMQSGAISATGGVPILAVDACLFCRNLMDGVFRWYSAKRSDPSVKANMPRLLQFRPNGFPPHLIGLPLIA
jgi:hypothetical protein